MKNNNYYEERGNFMLKIASLCASVIIFIGMIGLYVMNYVLHIKEGPWLSAYAIIVVSLGIVSTIFPGMKIGNYLWNKKHKDI